MESLLARLRSTLPRERGISIIDMVAVMAVIATMAAMATPAVKDALDGMRLRMTLRDVERELQFARLKAVSVNRPMRVRFNCPTAGQMRVVELIGSITAADARDAAGDRCSETAYPYRPTGSDQSRLTRPNSDGPIRTLAAGASFTASQTLEFWPDGSVHSAGAAPPWPTLAAAGATISVTRKGKTLNITVNSLGKIQIDH
jgi:hypothetical protein